MRGKVLAVVAAIAMVVGAIFVRSEVIEGGTNGGGGGGTEVNADAAVVCAAELPDIGCSRDEPLATTMADLSAEGARVPTWVTPGPWPQMVDEVRAAASQPRVFRETPAIATTELVVVIRKRPAACAQAVTWKCIGMAADPAASPPTLAAPSKATSVRLLALAAIFAGLVDNPSFVSNDFDERGAELQQLLTADRVIEAGRDRGARSLAEFLLVPGADVFITTRADVNEVPDTMEVVTPTPTALVVATVGSSREVDVSRLRDRLVAEGWKATPGDPDAGLPSPGVLVALREVTS